MSQQAKQQPKAKANKQADLDFLRLAAATGEIYLKYLDETGTVIVQDNSSIHTSKAVKLKILEWQGKGLFLFQLPPYCPQMNSIELEWLHLKRDHISGQMFDSQDYLIWSLEDALQARYVSPVFDTSYFEFSYA